MKVAFTADLHAGLHGRLDDILWSARVVRQYCADKGIDVVGILGDLFHDRKALQIGMLARVCEFFEETQIRFNQEWFVFLGNHDLFLKHSWGVNSLCPLRRHLKVIEDVKIVELGGRRFWILPFLALERPYMRLVNRISSKYREGDVILTHIGVNGATLNTCFLLKDWSFVTFAHTPFRRVYTGHFHSTQQVGENVWYPGSPIPFKFDEGDVEHGFFVYDTDIDEHEFVNIWEAGRELFPDEPMPPQYLTIPESGLRTVTAAEMAGCIVRVATEHEYTDSERTEARNGLTKLGARVVRFMNLAQKAEAPAMPADKPVFKEYEDLWGKWKELDQENIQKLRLSVEILDKCHQDVVHEAEQRYSQEFEEE